MSEKKQTKEIKIKLNYYKSKSDKENGVYFGGVVEPKYTDELKISIADDYEFDMDSEDFKKNGMYALEISGSNRALKELGKFLINISMFKTEDDDYHEHIDMIKDSTGNPMVNVTIRKEIQ